jgi:ribose transport system substrate-binding protein
VITTSRRAGLASAAVLLGSLLAACTTGTGGNDTPEEPSAGSWSPDLLSWHDAPGPFAEPVDNGDAFDIDLGNGQSVSLAKDDPLKFIYFLQGTSNTYLQAEADGAQAAADALGVDLTLVDAEFDAATQRSQIQNALSSGAYNGAAIRPTSSEDSCLLLTEDAPAANVPVIVVDQLTCGRDNNSGEDMWAPGLLAYVGGGGGSFPFYQQWAQKIASSMDKPTKTAVIVGPAALGAVQVTVDVLEQASEDFPNMELLPVSYTDFTDAGGLTAIQNVIQANPDLGAVVLEYGGQTPAVIRGIDQAGKTGEIDVYEAGGDKNAKQELLDGTLTLSAAQAPYSSAYCAIEMLVAAHSGEKVPRVVYNDCNNQADDPTKTSVLFITKDNVADYIPDY